MRQATAQQAVLRQRASSDAEQAGGRALLWGIVSFVLMCIPIIPSLLSWMAYSRSQLAARTAGVAVPTRGKVGLSIALLQWAVIDRILDLGDRRRSGYDARVDARKAVLTRQITGTRQRIDVDQAVFMRVGRAVHLEQWLCGRHQRGLVPQFGLCGRRACVERPRRLSDFKLATSSTSPTVTATICFKHGERWFVERTGVVSCELSQ